MNLLTDADNLGRRRQANIVQLLRLSTCQGPLLQQQPGCTTRHSLLPPPVATPPERHLPSPACQQGEQEGSHALRLADFAPLCNDLHQAQCEGHRVQLCNADLGCHLKDGGRQRRAQVDDVHSKRLQQDHKIISRQPLGLGLGNKLGLEDVRRSKSAEAS